MRKAKVTNETRLFTLMHGEKKDAYRAIVLDIGSGFCKAGFTEDDKPSSVVPNVIKYIHDSDDIFIGSEEAALKEHHDMMMRRPINRGIVTNWGDLERIWKYALFNELKSDPTQHPILVAVPSTVLSEAKAFRERVARIVFETLDAPAIDFVNQSVLALYANGRTTGCVVHSGYDVTSIVPIYDGYVMQHAARVINLGGNDVTKYLRRLLVERCNHSKELLGDDDDVGEQSNLILCDIKHNLCFVALDFDREKANIKDLEQPYTLPNGDHLTIQAERFQCPEVMFQPSLIGLVDEEGIADSVVSAINIIYNDDINNEDIRGELYANITLAGGNTTFSGMEERILSELRKSVPASVRVNIVAQPLEERKFSTWRGGSMIASLVTFGANSWIPKEDYDEYGPEIIDKRKSTS